MAKTINLVPAESFLESLGVRVGGDKLPKDSNVESKDRYRPVLVKCFIGLKSR